MLGDNKNVFLIIFIIYIYRVELKKYHFCDVHQKYHSRYIIYYTYKAFDQNRIKVFRIGTRERELMRNLGFPIFEVQEFFQNGLTNEEGKGVG